MADAAAPVGTPSREVRLIMACPAQGHTLKHSTPLTDAAYQTAIATRAFAHMPFQQAHRVALAYGYQAANQKAFDIIRDKFFIAHPYTVAECIHFLGVFVSNEQLASAAYAPLIGADTARWPTFSSNRPSTTTPQQ